MELLSKCPLDQAYQLVHGVLDGICGHAGAQYNDYSKIWSLEDWWLVTDAIKLCCRKAANNGLKIETIQSSHTTLPASYQDMIIEVLRIREDDVHCALEEQTNAIAESSLTDFDWKVKLAIAGDNLASIQQPLITLDLAVQTNDSRKISSVEMNKEELKKLITSLDAANKAVMQLKT